MHTPPKKFPSTARISRPIASPIRSSSTTSHVAPLAMVTGKAVPCPATHPRGPSTNRVPGIPEPGHLAVHVRMPVVALPARHRLQAGPERCVSVQQPETFVLVELVVHDPGQVVGVHAVPDGHHGPIECPRIPALAAPVGGSVRLCHN